MRYHLVIFLLATINQAFAGQGDQYLTRFSLDKTGGKVLIQFTTVNGFSCEDIRILAGTDTNALEEIHLYPGICGSEDKEVYYSYLWDEPIYNQKIFIRIDLGLFGETVAHEILVNRILENQSQVVPNPVIGDSRLIFDLGQGESCDVIIYGSKGQIIHQYIGIKSNELVVKQTDFKSGVYFYVITTERHSLKGRFIVSQN